jgi:hypothetical protein
MFKRPALAAMLLSSLAGCWWPTDAAYSPRALEQPTAVKLVYGTVIDARFPVTVESSGCATGRTPFYRPRGRGTLLLPFGIICQAFLNPATPAVEYTVLLDGSGVSSPYIYPPPPSHQTILVVQSHDPYDPYDPMLPQGSRVFVRAVAGTGRLFAANRLPPGVEEAITAPAPIQGPPPPYYVAGHW